MGGKGNTMAELLIWCLGGLFTLGAFAGGWCARAYYYRAKHQYVLGIRVCAKCGEPVEKGVCRQANGQWLHPHCKTVA